MKNSLSTDSISGGAQSSAALNINACKNILLHAIVFSKSRNFGSLGIPHAQPQIWKHPPGLSHYDLSTTMLSGGNFPV